MFGLEDHSKDKAKAKAFVFDLEEELKSRSAKKDYLTKIDGRMHKLKQVLRDGEEDQDLFNKLGALLYGYSALIKIVSRIEK